MSTGKAEDSGTAVYVISVAAELSGMHAQTLRTYDRMGLVSPARTRGGGRRYPTGTSSCCARFRRCLKTMASTLPASSPSSS